MRIDLNDDLGEERGDDAAIFPCISSANIACGAHAGGSRAIDSSLALAATLGVTVGAHVSYEDRANFGRLPVSIDHNALTRSLVEQIGGLQEHAARFGVPVRYVKPHGALYHRVGADQAHGQALVDAVLACDATMELLVPFSPMLLDLAAGLHCRHEFFADRGYLLDGQLVGRGDPRAYVDDVEQIVDRTMAWLRSGEVRSVEGKAVRILADSICLHGDSALAVRAAQALRTALISGGYRIVNWMQP